MDGHPQPGYRETVADSELDDPAVRARIVAEGPIGHWQTVPGTHRSLADDAIHFDADGAGRLHSWSLTHGPQTESFSWRLEEPGVLALRPEPAEDDEAWQRVPFTIERHSTDIGSFWTMREATGPGFWWLLGPLVRA